MALRLSVEEWKALVGKQKSKPVIAGGYTSHRKGWRTIGSKRYYFKSMWEMNYARYLEFLKINGDIKEWYYEPKLFRFPVDKYKAGPFYYKPDFLLINRDNSKEWHEVKGYLNTASKKKIKRFEKHHPTEGKIKIIDKTWFAKARKQLSGIIPGWESLSVPHK